MLEPYKPENFGGEYYALQGSKQYPMFIATALGVKPCYDDWVRMQDYDNFVSICKDYGLEVVPELIFDGVSKNKSEIRGSNTITTTFSEVRPFREDEKSGRAHVFVAKTMKAAIETKKFGWYTGTVVGDRTINKPFIDHLRFGKCLGYPPCCIDFFRRFNNWAKFSHPFESFKNTKKAEGEPIGSHYCNNFMMDNTYSLIHHLPCSYRCPATISMAKLVEEKIEEVEPGYVRRTEEITKMPLLVFGERHFVIFDGKKNGSRITYRNSRYFSNPARAEERMGFSEDISLGDNISFDGGKLCISQGSRIIRMLDVKENWFMIDFE